MQWISKPVSSSQVDHLSKERSISPRLARLLVLRGLQDSKAAFRFLHPRIEDLHDPGLMQDMGKAVERIQGAIRKREKMLLYGDYDVDGVTAAVLLLKFFRASGAVVDCFIPHRTQDGYGMREERMEWAAQNGYELVLSVDTGTRDWASVERARQLDMDCIVLDHHLPGKNLPRAFAILNPHRADCLYPEKNLTAVGVVFKLIQGLLGAGINSSKIEALLPWVVIGTIADCAPLTGENRVITRLGLRALRNSRNPGIRELLRVSDLEQKEIRGTDVGFRIAPRINAAGRMTSAQQALDLFLTSDAGQARTMAEELNHLNVRRQRAEEKILGEAVQQVEADPENCRREAIVVAGPGWHRGVIGIVAQRLVERFYRPTFVISLEGNIGYGSGRSVPGFSLVAAMDRMKSLFSRYGGHDQAAGVTIPAENLKTFRHRLGEEAAGCVQIGGQGRVLEVDAEVQLSQINDDFFQELQLLEPCGLGNPKPLFAARGLKVLVEPRILKQKHLKLRVAQDGVSLDALGWRWAEQAPALGSGVQVDLAFRVEENIYQNIHSIQLIIQDIVSIEKVAVQR